MDIRINYRYLSIRKVEVEVKVSVGANKGQWNTFESLLLSHLTNHRRRASHLLSK